MYYSKIYLVFIMIIVVIALCHAQSGKPVFEVTLSKNPTAGEIGNFFSRVSTGELDIFNVLPVVVAKKDKALPALETLLFSPQDTIKKEYVLLVLDGISGKKAVDLIIRSAQYETDVEVRGKALSLLGKSQYAKAMEDSLAPNKEILHALYACASDTAMSLNASKRVGEIAREGIRNWTGRDLGTLPLDGGTVKEGGKKPDMAAYHEKYWQKIAGKLKWDDGEKKFEVKGQ